MPEIRQQLREQKVKVMATKRTESRRVTGEARGVAFTYKTAAGLEVEAEYVPETKDLLAVRKVPAKMRALGFGAESSWMLFHVSTTACLGLSPWKRRAIEVGQKVFDLLKRKVLQSSNPVLLETELTPIKEWIRAEMKEKPRDGGG